MVTPKAAIKHELCSANQRWPGVVEQLSATQVAQLAVTKIISVTIMKLELSMSFCSTHQPQSLGLVC
jgi:hypothetical protein